MADVGPENVATGVMNAWSVKGLARLWCPGGLWYGSVPQSVTATPYARLLVRQGDTKRYSGGRYTRTFTVAISAWADNGPAGDISDLRTSVASLMKLIAVPGAVKVLDVKPGGNELALGDSPRNANDVSVMNLEFTVTIEGG
jgi:hypothetical protein